MNDEYWYLITVQFGVRASGSMGCDVKQNVTKSGGIFIVPPDIVVGSGQEYCYNTVLISNGNKL